jgi:hypothetical protein
MNTLLVSACILFCSSAFGADCVTNARGKSFVATGKEGVAVNPNTGTATSVQKNAGAASAQSSKRNEDCLQPIERATPRPVSRTPTGSPTTQSARGGEVKSKNGKGVVQGPQRHHLCERARTTRLQARADIALPWAGSDRPSNRTSPRRPAVAAKLVELKLDRLETLGKAARQRKREWKACCEVTATLSLYFRDVPQSGSLFPRRSWRAVIAAAW